MLYPVGERQEADKCRDGCHHFQDHLDRGHSCLRYLHAEQTVLQGLYIWNTLKTTNSCFHGPENPNSLNRFKELIMTYSIAPFHQSCVHDLLQKRLQVVDCHKYHQTHLKKTMCLCCKIYSRTNTISPEGSNCAYVNRYFSF